MMRSRFMNEYHNYHDVATTVIIHDLLLMDELPLYLMESDQKLNKWGISCNVLHS